MGGVFGDSHRQRNRRALPPYTTRRGPALCNSTGIWDRGLIAGVAQLLEHNKVERDSNKSQVPSLLSVPSGRAAVAKSQQLLEAVGREGLRAAVCLSVRSMHAGYIWDVCLGCLSALYLLIPAVLGVRRYLARRPYGPWYALHRARHRRTRLITQSP